MSSSESTQSDERETPAGDPKLRDASEKRSVWTNLFGPLDPWEEITEDGDPVDSRIARGARIPLEATDERASKEGRVPGSELAPVIGQQKRLFFWSRACLFGAALLVLVALVSVAVWLSTPPPEVGSDAGNGATSGAPSETALMRGPLIRTGDDEDHSRKAAPLLSHPSCVV
jgi:hypothetical protein